MSRRSTDVTDRLIMGVALAVVVAGSIWGLFDSGNGSASSSLATRPKPTVSTAAPVAAVPRETTTTIATTTVPYPVLATHPEALRGLGDLAYLSGGQLFVLDGTGAAPYRVPGAGKAGVAGATRVRLSENGGFVAYQEGTDLWVAPTFGGRKPRLVSEHVAHWDWSPSVDVLAVVERPSNISALGGDLLLSGYGNEVHVAPGVHVDDIVWSPDGHTLAFTAETDVLAPGQLYVASIECTSDCTATTRPIPINAAPDQIDVRAGTFAGWSEGATRVFVWLDPIGSASIMLDGLPIASIPLDGTLAVLLPSTLVKPSWVAPIPSTQQVLLNVGEGRSWFDSQRSIDSCDVTSGACTQLVNGDGPVVDPAISFDGQHLAYVQTDSIEPRVMPSDSIRWNASRRLVVAGINNDAPHVIADGGVIAPRWSRDARHLVFARQGYLWVVDVAGGDAVAVAGPINENDGRASLGLQFEEQPYLFPGDDVWSTADWTR